MADQGGLPAKPPLTPGLPQSPILSVFSAFTTLNTHATRPAIDEQEMYVSDGFMPLGPSNLRILPGVGPSLYSAVGGLQIVLFAFANIGSTAYCYLFLSDGSVVQVGVSSGVATTIAPAGTILNPSATQIGVSQWGSKYVVIVASQPNGYFLWDGVNFYQAGDLSPLINILSDGFDYTSPPSITAVGGSGSGATFTSTILNGALDTISVVNPGSGYSYADSVYLAFTGGGGNTTAQGVAVLTSGTVSSISITEGGTGYTSTSAVVVAGGGGVGATGSVLVSGGAVTSISLTNAGEGYTSSPTIIITDANNPVAQATVTPMPFGVSGTAAEVYQSRVWVANKAQMQFTAPEGPADFDPFDGAGAFTSNDSFLRVGFSALRQTNGFLYLLADSSINYISGVSTSGDPPVTNFTNQNVDPQIGTPWPLSVQVFSRNIVFANSFGVHVSYGGAVTKVSDNMDYFFSNPKLFSSFNPSSAVAVIFGIHVYMLLLPAIDQLSGALVNKLLMWDGKRWWTSQQEPNLVQIATQEINSVMTAWGSDGVDIFPLFQRPSTGFTKSFQSKLWDTPSYLFTKTANNVLGMAQYNVASSNPLLVSVDNGVNSVETPTQVSSPVLVWTNAMGDVVPWTNALGAAVTWTFAGLSVFGFSTNQQGPVLGLTVQTLAPDVTFISLMIVGQNYSPNYQGTTY